MRYYDETVPFTCFHKEEINSIFIKILRDYFENSNLQYVLSYKNKSVFNIAVYSREL